MDRSSFIDGPSPSCLIDWRNHYGKTVTLEVHDVPNPRQVFAVEVRNEAELRADDFAEYDPAGLIDARMRQELAAARADGVPKAFWAVFGNKNDSSFKLEFSPSVDLKGNVRLSEPFDKLVSDLSRQGYPGVGAALLLVATPDVNFPPMMRRVDAITEATAAIGFADKPGLVQLIQAAPISSDPEESARFTVFTFIPYNDYRHSNAD